jgi:hypothetical protein
VNTCSSCGAAIIWVVTKAGRPMPCDPEPVRMLVSTGAMVDVGHGPQPEYEVRAGFRSHFATCPDGDKHRKG